MSTVKIKGLQNKVRGANVGKISDPLEPGLIISAILVPFAWTFAIAAGDSDAAILGGLETALNALLLNAAYVNRGFYIGAFEGFTDKSEATQYQTFGYGGKRMSQRRKPGDEYQIVDGGAEYWAALQTFNGKVDQYKLLKIDSNDVLYGTDTIDPTTGIITGIQGYMLQDLQFEDVVQQNKGSVEGRMMTVIYEKPVELNQSRFAIETGIDLDGFVSPLAVQDVDITPAGPMVAKVVDCSILAGDGGINLCDTIPGLIVAASFKFTNVETGSTVITLTSVAIVNHKARFTFAGTGAGWVATNHMLIELVDVTTLATAGFKYYESTIPAVPIVMVP